MSLYQRPFLDHISKMVLPLSLYSLVFYIYISIYHLTCICFSVFFYLIKFHESKRLFHLLYPQHPVQSLVFDMKDLHGYFMDIY